MHMHGYKRKDTLVYCFLRMFGFLVSRNSSFLRVGEMASCHSRVWSEAQENSSGRLMTLTSVSNRPGWPIAILLLSLAHFVVKLSVGISDPGFWELELSNDKTDYCRWEL